jgi:hypothetical protein
MGDTMRKTILTALVIGLLTVVMAIPAVASNGKSGDSNGRPGSGLTVTVESSGLTYDSIVTAQLPAHGPFQKLVPVDGHLTTAYGPGDPGYLGGRWWLDANGNNEMDPGETFLCPLLGPGS